VISLFIQCLSESGLEVFENTKDRFEAVREEAIAGRRDKKWIPNDVHDGSSTVIGWPCNVLSLS